MKGKILIAFFVFILLVSIIPYNSVLAISTIIPEGFQGTTTGIDITNGMCNVIGTSKRMSGTFYPNLVGRTGTPLKGFQVGNGAITPSGYINFTLQPTEYLTGFSWFSYESFSYAGGSITMYFFNRTYDTYSSPIIYMRYYATSKCELQYDAGVGWNNIGSYDHFHSWARSGWNITDTSGTVEYFTAGIEEIATAYGSGKILSNYKIDSLYIISNSNLNWIYLDDLNITISDSYAVGGTVGGCISTTGLDYYSKNIEVMDGYIDISTPFIEFTSGSSLSLTPEVFELWVGSALYEGDSDTSNYFLYINGVSCGNPICFYLLSGETYVMQWDLSTFSPISEEVLIFEVAHTITFDGNNYWNIAKVTPSYIYGPPSPTMITYRNTGTNGVLDGSPYYYGSCWKLYYSAFGNPEEEENNDFDVGINLIGFNTHSVYNIPYSYIYDTVFFEVFSNRTDNYYHINISKGSSPMGNEQNYPKDIYSYHVIHGFTPTSQGNYTVSLCKDSTNTTVDHKHFNVTTKTVDYAIWTFPNPSNTGANHGVGVYISDDSTFLNFYVSGVVDSDNVNNYTLAIRKIKVGTLDTNKYWSTSLVTFASGGWEYWRLWGTNDNVSFIPLTSVYQHYVNSLTTNNYIRTSLTNGEGYVGESFNVYGQHGYILSQLQVYLDNKPIKDVSMNVSFLIPYSFSSVGTHTFSLRILNDGEWEIVDSVVVSMVFRPSGDGELSGLLPPPYSYIMGAIITIALMILPSVGLGKIGMSESESLKYVPIFSGTVGFILCCLIGFFPWYSIFALLFVLIMIVVILYLSKKNQ